MKFFDGIVLKQACELSIQYTTAHNESTGIHHEYVLSSIEKKVLVRKILALPDPDIGLLFSHYIFDMDDQTASELLEIEQFSNSLLYLKQLLALGLGLPDDMYISDISMQQACEMALPQYLRRIESRAGNIRPSYSHAFRNKLKMIRAARQQKNIILLAVQRAAAFLIASSIGFSAVLAVNAEFREQFFKWVQETFPQFSSFGMTDIAVEDTPERYELLKYYVIQDIPDEYELTDHSENYPDVIYSYRNNDDKIISFMGSLPNSETTAFDTENIAVTEIIFDNEKGYCWQKDGYTFLLWKQDGFAFSLITQLEVDQTIAIAQSVVLEK